MADGLHEVAGGTPPVERPPMRVAVFNVKYSPNLGDGVIALCLEWALAARLGNAEVRSLDLAGRQDYVAPSGAGLRRLKLALLQRLPGPLRDKVVEFALGRLLQRRLKPAWRRALAGTDAAVFGGGQLIQDGDLNFPLKLAAAADECHRRHMPTAVFGVGVAKSRSERGRRLLAPLLNAPSLAHLAVRDAQSISNLCAYCERPAELCRDPGLLAARLWPSPPRPGRERALIGVGITHPVVLNHHHSHGADRTGTADGIEQYGRIVDMLVSSGFDVLCFSNGAGEDEAFIAAARQRLLRAGGAKAHVAVAPRPPTPRALAELIAGCDGVVSHRLHAGIVAYSYGVPSIGLRWDSKLDAFFEAVGRVPYIVDFDAAAVGGIGALMVRGVAEGVNADIRRRTLDDAEAGIDRLADALARAIEQRRTDPSASGAEPLAFVSSIVAAGSA
ncbi:polysaccharide pyruvyl transferase family protein [Labrys monachus]|uniref:Polysaccharide pyruvyl transferase WcaK-like protein n=1 Tax=Labrys monachus TaxID=217067 RepID=A0ABU0FA10_9HYPH|nr:polysaccharide pyruvyl transferase family protein [Labrys monachus]MDQ0391448.1 polysaccharide pyruvyl transferase WcaK-like protein [Labrys monachus]